ncbi:hypothetical protein RE9425_03300 [Prescottella equi]|nr:hypothetical protein RE9425_03300 [Prescottella equi]
MDSLPKFPVGMYIVTAGHVRPLQILIERDDQPVTVITRDRESGEHIPVSFHLHWIIECRVGRPIRLAIEAIERGAEPGPVVEFQSIDPVTAIRPWGVVEPCLGVQKGS